MAVDLETDEQIPANLDIEEEESSDIEIVEVQHPQDEQELFVEPRIGEDEASKSPAPAVSASLKTMRCPICLETPEIVAVAACGHPYCHECIFPALSSSRLANRREGQCSLCRKRVRYDQVIFMELKVRLPNSATTTEDSPPASS